MANYEYAIKQRGIPGLHRGPWSEQDCKNWVNGWDSDCKPGQEALVGMFYIVRRPVGEWERV